MNEAQAAGMERAGETGDIIDRRAGERRAAAPVVAALPKATDDALLSLRAACDWIGQQDSTYGLTKDVAKAIDTLEATLSAPVVAVVAADLHRDIMNLPCVTDDNWSLAQIVYHRKGHKAARHAAAELVSAALASQAQAAVSAPVDERAAFEEEGRAQGHEDFARHAEGDYRNIYLECAWKGWQQRAGLAAQAAVGVASQQEQQPQPSCNAALRAAPEDQQDASAAVLTDERIIELAVENGLKVRTGAGAIKFARVVCDELARRFRAPGGNTNDKASPDLASIASQAQGEDVDALRHDFAIVKNFHGTTYTDITPGYYAAVNNVFAFVELALQTPTES